MYDYSSVPEFAATPAHSATAERPAVLGTALGLLGFASLFTACGAIIAPFLGPNAILVSVVGSLGTLLALFAARDRSPLNLVLLYAFATFEGLVLGLIVESYLTRGMGTIVPRSTRERAEGTSVLPAPKAGPGEYAPLAGPCWRATPLYRPPSCGRFFVVSCRRRIRGHPVGWW